MTTYSTFFIFVQEGACHSNGKKNGVTIDGFAYVPKRNNTALKIAIAKYGSAAVSINTNPMTFKFYGWGIYDDPNCGKDCYLLNHYEFRAGLSKVDKG